MQIMKKCNYPMGILFYTVRRRVIKFLLCLPIVSELSNLGLITWWLINFQISVLIFLHIYKYERFPTLQENLSSSCAETFTQQDARLFTQYKSSICSPHWKHQPRNLSGPQPSLFITSSVCRLARLLEALKYISNILLLDVSLSTMEMVRRY